jgi:hypothetical protein
MFVEGNAVMDFERSSAVGLDAALGVSWSQRAALGRSPGLAVGEEGAFVAGEATGRNGGVFARRVDPDGNPVWTTTLSRVSLDSATAVVLAPGGDVVVAGTTIADLGGSGLGNSHGFLARLSGNGVIRWVVGFGSGSGDYVTDLATDGADHYWAAGVTLGSVVEGQESAGGVLDAFAVEFDGEQLRAFQAGTSGEDWANAIAVDACGHAFLGGYTDGSFFPGEAQGRRDGFVLRIP